MGATCCYCGQCGKAGLLPALQPAATEWTQYPDSRSHGPEAFRPPPAGPAGPASLPALLSVQLSIIHLSGCGSKLHPVQCSKDATHTTHSFCEWVRTDSPTEFMAGSTESGQQHDTSFTVRREIQDCFCFLFNGCEGKQPGGRGAAVQYSNTDINLHKQQQQEPTSWSWPEIGL